ncbi:MULTISPECIES: IS200/IS605 family transposase [Okeania]|uniref:IS200/IS605 family transposase n=1 Tax=Okeania hirsuta TaxID=1458930 RepID=A0A3N6PL61_9CYAN|nr:MULTISPECIES: IS200/IS605 family transposase [Okeania]NET16726.1 IS200/IS605 family transposase [Okeania sp. SIO1H6]NES75129.1 IS200/IS605 family transposase [Okeania sp. SIO1H4]NES91336.1 IS200/IS605 family transposase [Okeania sp. SIO2B9]NET21142.1 IS200/IS605 family transposase [Okeania sp. SIO1H5]NET78153.1 IS200/IS605 family transposase [Okeania sp. SIO1F9]
MSSNYNKGFRSVYSLTVHIVFVTKYRRKVITSEMLQQLNKIFDQTCQKWECELVEFNGEVDHVHLLITFNPKVQLSKFIANLKTVSSRLIRRDFADYLARFYRKPVLWTGSYFVASCGGVTIEQLKQYVEHQSTPT